MADSNFVVKNGIVVNTAFTANSTVVTLGSNLTVNTSSVFIGNSTANTVITGGSITLNGVAIGVNANNASYLGGVAAGSYQLNSTLAANVATLTANNSTNLGGVVASGYQTIAGLAANVATLTANNATNLGGVAASGYQTTAGLAANVATLTANNATYHGGQALSAFVMRANTTSTDLNLANSSGFYRVGNTEANRPAENTWSFGQLLTIYGGSDTITQIYGNYADGQLATRSGNPTNVGGAGSWGAWRTIVDSANYNTYAPTLTGTGASGTWAISITGSANNASYLGGTAAAGYQTTAGLSANVAVLTANAANFSTTQATSDSSTKIATTEFVKASAGVMSSATISATGTISTSYFGYLVVANTAGITLTMPAATVGQWMQIYNSSAGNVTLSSTTIYNRTTSSATFTLASNRSVYATCISNGVWILDDYQTGSAATQASTAFAAAVHGHAIGDVTGLQTALDAKLASASYTASDVLTKMKTVDGTGSGLDADVVRGTTPSTYGLARLSDADAEAARSGLGLGTAATLDASAVGLPSGSVIYFAANAAPTGFLKANGALVSRTTYAALFAAIGTTFGAGDGSTTFGIPDLRGEFVRGWDDARGVDSGRAFASAQSDMFRSHTHPAAVGGGRGGSYWQPGSNMYTTGTDTGSAGGAETRPRNIALLACIKY